MCCTNKTTGVGRRGMRACSRQKETSCKGKGLADDESVTHKRLLRDGGQ